jgi:hypothetical protein
MNYIYTEKALTVFHDNKVHTLHADDKRWNRALELLRADDIESLVTLLNPAEAIINYTSASGHLRVENGVMKYKSETLPGNMHIVARTLAHIAEGLPVGPLVNYIERLMKNPSHRAIQELLGFLEYGNLPITSDGCFLAYKRVTSNYKDCHSGTIDNNIGQIVSMERRKVDDDCNNTCSYGLHFCSKEYLNSFPGARLMALKIDPADVVSIPVDYNNTKGRTCRYTVVAELDYDPTRDDRWDSLQNNDYDDTAGDGTNEGSEPDAAFVRGFEVGDEVRVKGRVINTNTTGTIVEDDGIPDEGIGRFLVDKGENGEGWYDTDELELIKKHSDEPLRASDFSVDDKVEITGDLGNWNHGHPAGTHGTILRTDAEDDTCLISVPDKYPEWVSCQDLKHI